MLKLASPPEKCALTCSVRRSFGVIKVRRRRQQEPILVIWGTAHLVGRTDGNAYIHISAESQSADVAVFRRCVHFSASRTVNLTAVVLAPHDQRPLVFPNLC